MNKHVKYLFLFLILLTHSAFAATILQVTEKNIIVDGKKSHAFFITQPDGTFGYYGKKGEAFDVTVENKTKSPLVLHWHGVIVPNAQDGVPYVTQLPILPGQSFHYKFKLKQAGTFWIHSHYQLQIQQLMAAPLIIRDPKEKNQTEALMFLQDFTFKNPAVIYEDLRHPVKQNNAHPMMMNMTHPDVNDVTFDAYLTNHRTLKNPDIITVTPLQTLRLRIINASASSNYFIDLGKLTGTLIAMDGAPIQPVTSSRFQIAIGNRLDILLKIPKGEGIYPILALPEGTKKQTGLLLKTKGATIPSLSEDTIKENALLTYAQDLQLKPITPLKDAIINHTLVFNLEGNMQNYVWTMNGEVWPNVTPYIIKPNERIALLFNNKTNMPHPMHFHGHVFQIVEINGQSINGRLGDTVDVLPNSTVKVIFDADNPGIWMMHCHILYHQMGGMMTTINYAGYPERFTLKQRESEMQTLDAI